jgi:hypothetical protein
MLLLRKIDYTLQLALACLMILSIPFFFFFGFMAGLFLMGCWQLLSAVSNTNSFIRSGLSKEIINYWKFTGIVMASLFACFPLSTVFGYYLRIYNKLIDALKMRHELGGLIKSKH